MLTFVKGSVTFSERSLNRGCRINRANSVGQFPTSLFRFCPGPGRQFEAEDEGRTDDRFPYWTPVGSLHPFALQKRMETNSKDTVRTFVRPIHWSPLEQAGRIGGILHLVSRPLVREASVCHRPIDIRTTNSLLFAGKIARGNCSFTHAHRQEQRRFYISLLRSTCSTGQRLGSLSRSWIPLEPSSFISRRFRRTEDPGGETSEAYCRFLEVRSPLSFPPIERAGWEETRDTISASRREFSFRGGVS